MSIRRSHRNGNQGATNKARIARIRDKALRMRERVKQSIHAMVERRMRHLTWWQRAFRTPMVAGQWIFSSCRSLWAAFFAFFGLKPRQPVSLAQRHGVIRNARRVVKSRGDVEPGKVNLRAAMILEQLEERKLFAYDLVKVVDDTYTNAGETDLSAGFPATPTVLFAQGTTGQTAFIKQSSFASASSDITIEASSISFINTNPISVTKSITLDTNASVQGSIVLPSSGLTTSSSQSILVDAGTTLTAPSVNGGALDLSAVGDVQVGLVDGGTSIVTITSATGAISKSGIGKAASSNQVNLIAATGISLNLGTPKVNVTNSSSGDITLVQQVNGQLEVIGLTNTGAGDVNISNQGAGGGQNLLITNTFSASGAVTLVATKSVQLSSVITGIQGFVLKADSDLNGSGDAVLNATSSVTTSSNKDILIQGAEINISGTAVNAGSGMVTLRPSKSIAE